MPDYKKSFLRKGQNPPGLQQQFKWLEQWYDSERGSRMRAREEALLEQMLAQAFGYFLLQLSVDSRAAFYQQCRVQKKYRLHPWGQQLDLQSDIDQLPFANESLDVVLMHHVQEFVSDPYQLLREVQRVVIPHGQVLIVGFNPWSLFGAYTAAHRLMPNSIWHNRLISTRRMRDWLGLLGFEILELHFATHHLATPLWSLSERLLPGGSFYVIRAEKRVAGITASRQRWKAPVASFPGLAPVKPQVAGEQGIRVVHGMRTDTPHKQSKS